MNRQFTRAADISSSLVRDGVTRALPGTDISRIINQAQKIYGNMLDNKAQNLKVQYWQNQFGRDDINRQAMVNALNGI